MKETMSNTTAKVSIIVPVYNVEKYLATCLDSLISQTLEEIEIIVVDDGAKDNSGLICDEYANKDSRIKVIHQKNAGLSGARNTGIRLSMADYIMFVDSDDYLKADGVERLYLKAISGNYDIVNAPYIEVNNGKEIPDSLNTVKGDYSGKDYLVKTIEESRLRICAQYGIYKRSLIVDNDLFFKEGILHEDEWWTPQVYLKASKVTYLDYHFYYYLIREGSITQAKDFTRNCKDVFNTCDELYEIYNGLDEHSRRVLNDYLCMIYLHIIYMAKKIDADKAFPLKTASSLKNRMKALLYAVSPKLYLRVHK